MQVGSNPFHSPYKIQPHMYTGTQLHMLVLRLCAYIHSYIHLKRIKGYLDSETSDTQPILLLHWLKTLSTSLDSRLDPDDRLL